MFSVSLADDFHRSCGRTGKPEKLSASPQYLLFSVQHIRILSSICTRPLRLQHRPDIGKELKVLFLNLHNSFPTGDLVGIFIYNNEIRVAFLLCNFYYNHKSLPEFLGSESWLFLTLLPFSL